MTFAGATVVWKGFEPDFDRAGDYRIRLLPNGSELDAEYVHGPEAIPPAAEITADTTTAYTLVLSDQVVTMDNASANTVTIPTSNSVGFPVGKVVTVVMKGAGTTTIEGDTGVTLNGTSAGSVDISSQYQAVSLLKIGTDEWIAMGAY